MILVVNEAETAPDHVSVANQSFAAELQARFRMCWQSGEDGGLTLFHDPASFRDVLLADRFSNGLKLPPKGGVGQARKIGADLAACLIHQRRVHPPWIHCTDADVRLPQRYFTCIDGLGGNPALETAALVYPFGHHITAIGKDADIPDSHQQRIMQVTRLYEYSLRYYVAGLGFANSPYAFHTIGSTMAVNASHYTKVRGFPRRQAGEDFYLLNKLAKVGSIRQLSADTDCEAIEIAARLSDRVPFGTGAATGRIMAFEDPAREFLLYHPAIFGLLRLWLGSLASFWQSRSGEISEILAQHSVSNGAQALPTQSAGNLQALIDGLEDCGAPDALEHAFRQSRDAAQFNRQMHTWFDAFRTLKLIHHLRDHHLSSVSFETLVTEQHPDHLMGYESTLPFLHKEVCRDWLDFNHPARVSPTA